MGRPAFFSCTSALSQPWELSSIGVGHLLPAVAEFVAGQPTGRECRPGARREQSISTAYRDSVGRTSRMLCITYLAP